MKALPAEELEAYYKVGHTCKSAGYLRFVLMAFVCFWQFGAPEPTGILEALSGFAIPAFFILSGYFTLPNDRKIRLEKIKRKIGRSALCFGALFAFYLLLNVLFCVFMRVSVSITKRAVFDMVVLNWWSPHLPIGSNIWFVQALLYAYVILFLADKIGLMKYYKVFLALTFLFMLITGEFAGLVHFHIKGYSYVPGNWLTRALPYLLLGRLIREKGETLFKVKKWICYLAFAAGAGLTVGELFLLAKTGFLVYQGHMAGYALMAFSACCLALARPKVKGSRITRYDTALSGLTYVFLDPAFFTVGLVAVQFYPGVYQFLVGMIALAVSVALAFLLRKTKIAKLFFTVH